VAGIGENSSILVSFLAILLSGPLSERLPGEQLKKVLERSWKWSKSQRAVATSLGEAVSPKTLEAWQKVVADYKADPSKPNPFAEPEISMSFLSVFSVFEGTEQFPACTLDSVRRQLLQEEADARKTGTTYLHEETPASFMRRALDIEERQYAPTS